MKYYGVLATILIISILSFIVVPTYFPYLWEDKLEGVIEEFRSNSDLENEVFTNTISSNNTSEIKTFDTKKLELLGEKIGADYSDIIKKINEPYGSYWIEVALAKTTTTMIHNLRLPFLKTNLKIFKLMGLPTLIGIFILLLFLLFSKNVITTKNEKKSIIATIIAFIGIIGSLLFLIIDMPSLLKIIKNPAVIDFYSQTFSPAYNYRFLIILLEIAFVLFLSILALTKYKGNNRFSYLWVFPILIILVNLFSQPSKFRNYQTIYQNENSTYLKQNLKNEETKIITTIRQWAKVNDYMDFSKFSQKDFTFPKETTYAKYSIAPNDTTLVITGSSLKQIYDKPYQFKIFYNIKSDSLKTKEI